MATAVKDNVKRFKHVMRRGLGRSGFSHRLLNDALCAFVYHEVAVDPSPFCRQFNLNVAPELFAEQIDFISDRFNVINSDQLLSGDYQTPAALITFDDGFPGYFREAVPILTQRKVPSTVFLNMAPVEGELFWSGLITYLCEFDADFLKTLHERYPDKSSVPDFLLCRPDFVEEYIQKVDRKILDEKVRAYVGPFADRTDLESVKGNPYVFFGNHLYHHYNALHLTSEELRDQYLKNDERISQYPNSRPVFAYPFGQPNTCFTEEKTEYIHSLGAKAVFCSSGRSNRREQKGFYDRIGIDSSIQTVEDLIGLIQWMQFKTTWQRR